ncbi:hypothetical protein SAMN05443639_11256 [Stigmatella erecta]|uniref:Uncharacterized protein n=1 Tax=Stigmatella erecta TaxID=83460 RepID=A0A1I0KNQ5_9BACT|nr:hypothetical protein SAMN05443639_11256 [Stigmatella erecta]
MLLTGWNPDDIAWLDLLDRIAPTLHPARARCHDQDLTQRMGVPGGTGAGFERDIGASGA